MENYFFLENDVTLEGAVSHVLLSTALHCMLPSKFFAINFFELLPIVPEAFFRHLKKKKIVQQGCLFFHYSLAMYYPLLHIE